MINILIATGLCIFFAGGLALIRNLMKEKAIDIPNKRLMAYIVIMTIGYALLLIGFIMRDNE